MSQATTTSGAAGTDLGANQFTFSGDRTQITYRTERGGPIRPGQQGGILEYQGIEGDFTFTGDEITLQDTTLGTLVTVTLKVNNDTGGLTVTVLIPRIIGAGLNKPVTFATVAIKTASRGFIATPGPSLTYTIVPLVGVASVVIIPLAQQADGQ
jgi:hypothetical protein